MKRFIILAVLLVSAPSAYAGAGIGAAFGNMSCLSTKSCTGPAINAAKQGTNNLYIGGDGGISIGFSKTGGKDSITISGTPHVVVNATAGNQTEDIILFNRVKVCKSDVTANTVTITDSTPRGVNFDPLSIQGECANLSLSAGIWYTQ